jgi:hypothetical protein
MQHKKNGPTPVLSAGPLSKDRSWLNDARVKPKPAPGQLVDRYGHVHSEAIFHNWSPAAIKALGIRRVGEGGEP